MGSSFLVLGGKGAGFGDHLPDLGFRVWGSEVLSSGLGCVVEASGLPRLAPGWVGPENSHIGVMEIYLTHGFCLGQDGQKT